MKQRTLLRTLALTLALALCIAPAAQALSVEEARALLSQHFIDPIPKEILNLPTIAEITAALGDPYTYYMTAEEHQQFQGALNDSEVVGIGAVVETLADGIHIVSVAPDSPAAKGGILPNDIIVGVDGMTPAQAGSVEALRQKIPGTEGTSVTLTILREKKTFDIIAIRAKVVFPIVTSEVVDGHIGWITCSSFGESTGTYFKDYITKEDKVSDRWVIDLRGNPGGYATAVIETASHVIGNSNVAYVANRNHDVSPWRFNSLPVEIPPILTEPLIVLADNNSASASELFAAAMRDYGTGLIIGTRSYGKGIAQNVFEQADGSAMKITTERYYSPKYVTPDRTGVLPHLVVDPNLADEVALLLSGKSTKTPGSAVLVITLAERDWSVHKTAALADKPGFAALLAALSPSTPMTLGGKTVTPEEVAKTWGTTYDSRYFTDVADSLYSREINTLAALDILEGTSDGIFDPKGELTRAQLSALIVQSMGYWCWESEGRAPFTDVAEDAWYAAAADILYHLDIVLGDGSGHFTPDALITHEQFLTILGRVGRQMDLSIREQMDKPDYSSINRPELLRYHDWSWPAVLAAEKYHFLPAPLKDLQPRDITTREEAAVAIYRLLEYSGVTTSVLPAPVAE